MSHNTLSDRTSLPAKAEGDTAATDVPSPSDAAILALAEEISDRYLPAFLELAK